LLNFQRTLVRFLRTFVTKTQENIITEKAMANPNPTRKGRPIGSPNKNTLDRELKVRAVQQHMIESGLANPEDFGPGDSLTWMEAMARNGALPMQERRQFAIAVMPYIYSRSKRRGGGTVGFALTVGGG
jgi:hypothetical protein